MARIRTLKPEFWADEKMAPLPPIDRLVFLGLISQADDDGRLVDNVRLIDGLLFPETQDTCGPSLDTLARLGRVLRYRSASGQRLIQVMGWTTHQKVDNHAKYTLPAPTPEDVAASQVTESSRDSSENGARSSTESRVPIPDPRPTTYEEDSVADATAAEPHIEQPLKQPAGGVAATLNEYRSEAAGKLRAGGWKDGRSEHGRPMTMARELSIWDNLVKYDPPEEVNAAIDVLVGHSRNKPKGPTLLLWRADNPSAQEYYRRCLAEGRKAIGRDGTVSISTLLNGRAP